MKKFIEKEKFNPSFLSIFFHPFFFVRREIYKFLKSNSDDLNGNILDFGAGSKPYEDLFKNKKSYLSIEVFSEKKNLNADIYYDGEHLPFPDNCFDGILCTEVLEHVENLDKIIFELYRVLKPGGKMIITTPFLCVEHEMPYDFRRFTLNGLINFLQKKNFKIIKSKKLLNNFNVFFQTFNFYLCQLFLKRVTILRFLIYFLSGVVNIFALIFVLFFPKIAEMYFGSGVVVQK